ncbi:hypothetical protein ACJX0J_005667, partial [Zea mays]
MSLFVSDREQSQDILFHLLDGLFKLATYGVSAYSNNSTSYLLWNRDYIWGSEQLLDDDDDYCIASQIM